MPAANKGTPNQTLLVAAGADSLFRPAFQRLSTPLFGVVR
jgi:hypothetical protein